MQRRVLIFGASSTHGFWDLEGGWAQRIRTHYDSLRLSNYFVGQPTFYNLSISGDTTSRLLKRFEQETINRKFPGEGFAFIFSIGTNNSYIQGGGKKSSTIKEYKEDLQQMIDKARKFSDKIMFVGFPSCDEELTTPTMWADIYYTNDRLLKFENAMRSVCAKNHVNFVPLFHFFKERFDKGENYFIDGLHLDGTGHQLIADLVLPELKKVLGEPEENAENAKKSNNIVLQRLIELAKITGRR